MKNITGQDSFIIAKALAIAIEAIDRLPEEWRAESDKENGVAPLIPEPRIAGDDGLAPFQMSVNI